MIPNKEFWINKKVLITGHTGFKGSWLSVYLHHLGADLYGVSREKKSGIYEMTNLNDIFKEEIFLDIGKVEIEELEKIIRRINPEIIFHFAAQSLVYVGHNDPTDTVFSNIIGTHNLLYASKDVESIGSIIVSTTDKVYEHSSFDNIESSKLGGKDYYSASKVAVENIIFAFKNLIDFPLVSVIRSGNVIGGGDRAEKRLMTELILSINENKDFLLRKPNSIRPWQYILDSIRGYLLTAEDTIKNNNSEVFNLNSRPNNKYNASFLANSFIKKWGSNIKIIEAEELLFDEVDTLVINSDKALLKLGWEPVVDIELMLEKVVGWEKYYKNDSEISFMINEINEYHTIISQQLN